ncbi:MAG: PKD domain-containing protein, partial [Bacteroidetes bacterium]|nr:PKD domain-containing protein [Bacteroidota bacterium]
LMYTGVYDGVDLEYYGKDGNLKYDIIVAAGTDPNVIQLKYEGTDKIFLEKEKLVVTNQFNAIQETIPLAYQVINGNRIEVTCRYVLDGTTVSFGFPNGYNPDHELVIDPTLIFSSYSGSTSDNFGFTATYDDDGALYGGGIAFGLGYPYVVGSYSSTFGGLVDMAISKFSPDGSSLLYSTFLGGASTDVPHSMIVNGQGELVILGSTSSQDYPTTTGAHDQTFNGGNQVNFTANGANFENGSDIVVTVLSADGSSLVGSTYLGGAQNDGLNEDNGLAYNYGDIFRGEVIVDADDNIYIVSSTESSDLPTTSGTVGQSLGGNQDACLARFNSDVSNLDWCTYLGGDGADAGYSLKLNSSEDIYVTGGTVGQNFPIVGNTLNTTFQGGTADGFLVHLNNSATVVHASSYIGTSGYDQSYFVEVDHDDDVYLYGQSAGNYSVTSNVYYNLNGRQFIQKLSPDLTTSMFSTVFGSGGAAVNISPTAFLVDICKRIYISGWGGNTNNTWNLATGQTTGMVVTPDAEQLTTDGSDFYFMVLEADATSLLYGSYFGGFGVIEHVDGGTSRFNSDGVIHQAVCAGCLGSSAFPTTPGVVSNTNNSFNCNLGVIKLDLEIPTVDVEMNFDTTQTGCVPFEIQFDASVLVASDFIWYFGDGDSSTATNPVHIYSDPGTYEVLLIGTNTNCTGEQFVDTAFVTINAVLGGVLVDAGPDLCIEESAQLGTDSLPDITYSWNPTVGLDNPNSYQPIASPNQLTEYVLTATNTNGCSNTDTVLVDVFIIEAIGDTSICVGDVAQLGALEGMSWNWIPTTGLSDPSAQFPIASPTTTTVYTVFADNGADCQSSDTVTVTVSPLPEAFAGIDQGVCAGSSVQLHATGGDTYQWTPTSGLSDPNISDPVVTFSSDTLTYMVTVTDTIGCSDTDSVTVWQEELPDATVSSDTTVCIGGSVQLYATGGTSYSWDPAIGLNNPSAADPIATPTVTTTYTVTVGQPTGNLVFNGGFSVGNVGFGSDYTYATQLNPEGLYSVVTDANSVHNAFHGTGHTGNAPVDSFMVVNGAGIPDQNVWCQTISVSPNTDYSFGTWVSSVTPNNPAILQFSINGQALGAAFTASSTVNSWNQFSETWNSGSATTATICVVNQNTNTGGNDFALDDITFSTICTNTAEVTVTVSPLPEADAGPDQEMCYGDVVEMAGSGGENYQWIPFAGLTNPTDPNTDASPNGTQTYILIVSDDIGCEAIDSMIITVQPLPTASAGTDQELCIGESVVLQGSGGVDFTWSPATYLDDPNAQLPISTPEETITYAVTVSDANNCENSDTVTVFVNPLPIIDAGPDSMICANSTLVLQASGGETYLWSPLIGLSDPQIPDPEATPLASTTYHVVGTDENGCVNSDSVNITIFSITAWPDSVICLNDSVQAFVSGGDTYQWSPSEGVSDPTAGDPFLSPEVSTVYTVTVTSEFGCEAVAEVAIDILIQPFASFQANFEPSCEDVYGAFTNDSENSGAYYWTFGDGETSSEFEPTHSFPPGAGGVITLVAYDNDSLCVDSFIVDLTGEWFGNDTIEIEYGNVFTPNSDNINDCFKPGFDGR